MSTFVIGITGATGLPITYRLVEYLLEKGHEIHLCASKAGRLVIQEELTHAKDKKEKKQGLLPGIQHPLLTEWGERNFFAPFASGSAKIDGMVVVPCSMSTVGSIAAGISDNLVRRAAEVCLKEQRKLILVARETPLSVIHLQNMLRAAQAGALILPPVMAFYQDPGPEVAAQIDHVVSRILDQLGVENDLTPRWGNPDR